MDRSQDRSKIAKLQDSGSVMDSMFETLLDLASSPDSTLPSSKSSSGTVDDDGAHIRALACACLLSFTVALADTGKLLRAATAMLMSPKGAERILMPQILVSLQRYEGILCILSMKAKLRG